MSTILAGLQVFIDNPLMLPLMVLGVFFGIVFGAIPGLTAALAVSLVLPFTYGMLPSQGIMLLISLYVGGISGGLTSAILLNIPGTPASLVTCFDGSPMAKKGRPGDALTIGVFASLFGGLFSAVALVVISQQLAKVALMFGPWEYFSMGLMGLAIVVSLCAKDMIKGFLAAIVGLLIASVGMDPVSGVSRFSFGLWQMDAGLGELCVLMGLFAFAEILSQLNSLRMKFTVISMKEMRVFPKKSKFARFSPFICSLPLSGRLSAFYRVLDKAQPPSWRTMRPVNSPRRQNSLELAVKRVLSPLKQQTTPFAGVRLFP